MKPLHIALFAGGRSAEHDVSLVSARNIFLSLDKNRYTISIVGIDRDGSWRFVDPETVDASSAGIAIDRSRPRVRIVPGERTLSDGVRTVSPDVAFPVLHGPFGEDGSIQGLFKHLDLPFVGASVTGSAVGMDKDVMKRLLRDAGIPIARFRTLTRQDLVSFREISAELGTPLFVKPVNMGSSIGVGRAETADEFDAAVEEAFRFDTRIIVEESINGREIECSVLGNEAPEASLPGEIISDGSFYSYSSKYASSSVSQTIVPADLSDDTTEKIRKLSIKAYQTLNCEGMARVDSFLTQDGTVYINEINTLPGFTSISMYPVMWEKSGLAQTRLLDRLIELALSRHEEEKRISTQTESVF